MMSLWQQDFESHVFRKNNLIFLSLFYFYLLVSCSQFHFDTILTFCLLALIIFGQYEALVISFLGLLITFVDDMLAGWKYVLISPMLQLTPLTCGTETGLRPNVLTDFHRRWIDMTSPLICRRACEYEPLL